jgi:hypothetical protein
MKLVEGDCNAAFDQSSATLPPQELLIEEEYTCDPNGDVEVRIRDKITQQTNDYRLGRWPKHRKKMQRR